MSGNATETPAQGVLLNDGDFLQTVATLEREGRWEELASVLIERAENVTSLGERVRTLVHAARIFQEELADGDRAYLILLVAFQTDPANQEAKTALGLAASTEGKWEELLGELSAFAVDLTPPEKQVSLYLSLAEWYQDHVGDFAKSEQALEAVLATDPAQPQALRALVDVLRRRGDNARAAMYLANGAQACKEPDDRMAYALEAAEIYRNVLGDKDAAAEQFRRCLEIQGDHAVALKGLAEIAWEGKRYSEALPLFEKLAGQNAADQEQSARYFHRAAWSAQMLGDLERARDDYRQAFGKNPGYLPTLLCWSELSLSQKWNPDVVQVVPTLLNRAESGLTQDERVEHLLGLGQARFNLGEVEAAAKVLGEAIELAPDHDEVRALLGKVHGRMSGQGPAAAQAVVEQQRRLLAAAKNDEERLDILEEIARIQREDLRDSEAALSTYFEILAMRPEDSMVLHEVLDLFTDAGQWKRAAEILECLARVSEGEEHLRYLVAWGNILSYELDNHDEAVAIYEKVLDANPEDERTFGRIERIYTASESWRDLARHVRKQIKRMGVNVSQEKRPRLIALWRMLGDLCWRKLDEPESASAAFEVTAELDPLDTHAAEALAELYERMGPEKAQKAIEARERILGLTSDADVLAQHIRSLARLYGKQQKFDRLYCTSAALVAMSRAIPQEQAFYERASRAELLRATGVLDEGIWQRFLDSPQLDRTLSFIFASLSTVVGSGRAKDAVSLGLDPSMQVDLATDRSVVGQFLIYCSRLLGIALPRVYVSSTFTGDLDMQLVLEGQQVVPSFVLGQSLVVDRGEKELAFCLGRKLARMRADHFLLWPSVVPDLNEHRLILAAAVSLVRPHLQWPGVDPSAMKKYAAFLQRSLPATALATLGPTLSSVVPETVDLEAWAAALRQSEDCAGLLCCGDVACALREVLKSHVHGRDSEGMALLRFSVSTPYLDLREHLGMILEVMHTPSPQKTKSLPRSPRKQK